MKKRILHTMAALLLTCAASAQMVVFKNDTLLLTDDSIVFKMAPYRGSLEWQFSNDKQTWTKIASPSSDSLRGLPTQKNAIVRAKITDGDCLPVYSDTAEYLCGITSDSLALVAIYKATAGPGWKDNTNWCTQKPLREWFGVTVENRRVTRLDLSMNGLTGIIPKEVGHLLKLKFLKLSYNKLTGSIPEEIGNLTELNELWITNIITLDGPIPASIGNLTKLENLNLSMNNLSGPIPEEIGQLASVKHLILGNNSLTGPIPASMGNLDKLEMINLASNQLSGNLPDFVTKWFVNKEGMYVSRFHLYANNMSGVLPVRVAQHPDFIYNYPGFILQNPEYGFDNTGLTLQIPQFEVKDIKGDTINWAKEYPKNKLTAIIDWSPTCGWSDMLTTELVELYKNYKDKGLEIIGVAFEHNVGNHTTEEILNYINNRKLPWRNFISTGNNWIGYQNRFPIYTNYAPNLYLVNSKGDIIWNRLMEKNKEGFKEVLISYFGSPQYYESKDYSEDGKVLTLQQSAVNQGNNLVFIGDGFSDRDMAPGGVYERRMKEAYNHFFSVEPTKTYKSYFNVYAVKAVSKNDFFSPETKTAIESEVSGCGGMIWGNYDKANYYASKVPGIDLTKTPVIIVLNTPVYAGTCHWFEDGSTIAFTPTVAFDSTQFGAIIHHEVVGHAFGRLLDEYINSNVHITPDFVALFNNNRTKYKSGYNLTVNKTEIPWQHYIGHPSYPMVNTREGGYFFRYGVWRSEENSCMNNNVPYFSAISRELIVRRILEQAGEVFNWETFAQKDKTAIPPLKKADPSFIPLAAPVYHEKSLEPLPEPYVKPESYVKPGTTIKHWHEIEP